MRPESIVLLAAAALLVCADGAFAKSVAVDFPVTIHDSQDAIPTKRLLRSSEDSEERVGFDTLTGLAKAGASKITGTTDLDTWLFHNVNGVQVLAKLQLGDDIAAALTSSKLKTLRKYIAMYNNKHTNTPTSLIETLTAHYGDDVVAKALAVAQKQPNTEALATQLRKNQMAIWVRKDRTGVDIFKLLSSGDDGYFTLTNLEILDDYIKLFNREKSAHETLLATLTTGIGSERRLAELLVVAKANPTTREKALELQSALFDKWLARKLRPETILRGLKLDDNVENALTHRNLQTLINYISVFNKNNPTSEATLIGTLIAHYGDDVVATALLSAKKVAGTKDMATVLQIQQLERWFNSGKSVDDVYALLKFPDDLYEVIASRKLEALDDYVKLFNRKKSADESVIKAMAAAFDGEDEVAKALETARRYPALNAKATELQNAQFAQWKNEGLKSEGILAKVFKIGETEAGTGVEESIVKRYTLF